MVERHTLPGVTRRAVLRASGAVAAGHAVGSVEADGGDGPEPFPCLESPVDARMRHCPGSDVAGCTDDHPETEAIQREVRHALETTYPTVGALIDVGYLPYFDLVTACKTGVSHWLHPGYIADESVLDADRPESILVDNRLWRPIGVMFIATDGGDPVARPPAVYDESDEADGADGGDEVDETDSADARCAPWHRHEELPARFAWWYYEKVYEAEGTLEHPLFPRETPCMMHVWAYPHPEGVYAHGAPPPAYRPGEPADPGFPTDAEPGTDELGWDVLPEVVVERAKPTDAVIEWLETPD